MKKIIKKMFDSVKGALSITDVVIDVVLLVALIPIIATFLGARSWGCFNEVYPTQIVNESTAELSVCTNTTANVTATLTSATSTELVLLGLTTLFLVLALVFTIVKQSGLTKKK